MSSSKSPVLSAIKYGALILAFILGYQFVDKQMQPFVATAGWILGFILGLKLQLKYANRS